jgi:hypothetical protein
MARLDPGSPRVLQVPDIFARLAIFVAPDLSKMPRRTDFQVCVPDVVSNTEHFLTRFLA